MPKSSTFCLLISHNDTFIRSPHCEQNSSFPRCDENTMLQEITIMFKLIFTLCWLLTMVRSFSTQTCLTCSVGRQIRYDNPSLLISRGAPFEEVDRFDDDEDVFDYDEEAEDMDDADTDSDWVQAELTLINAPTEPHPDLDVTQVAILICRSLQFVDYPTPNHGLKRCYPFFTHDCRAVVTARQGAKSVERFLEYGLLAPALQPFMGATRVDLGEATSYTEAKPPFRGALVSFPVVIEGAPILSLQHPSGIERNGVAAPPITNMVLRLEQQRRPPNQGCWMVREILDVRHAFAGDMGNAHVGG
jgi:hypothetical protein